MEAITVLSLNADNDNSTINLNKPPQLASNDSGHYETVEEIIARIKRNVIVTGTMIGVPGEETAIFQIEGMADRLFKINTQLMDGFIIKEITNTYVVLKNQIGKETFSLYVQSGEVSLPDSKLIPEFNTISTVPDVYTPHRFLDDVQNAIYSSEYLENTTQYINLQNEVRPLDDAALENGFSSMPAPHQYDLQQFSDSDASANN